MDSRIIQFDNFSPKTNNNNMPDYMINNFNNSNLNNSIGINEINNSYNSDMMDNNMNNFDNINNIRNMNNNMNDFDNMNNNENFNIYNPINYMNNENFINNFVTLNNNNNMNNNIINSYNHNNMNNGFHNNKSLPHFQNVNNNINNSSLFNNSNQKNLSQKQFIEVFGSNLKKSIYNSNQAHIQLYLNIIYYDENLLSSSENNENCSILKMITLGTFYGVHNYSLFKYIIKRLPDESNKRFILISSGSAANKVFKYCEICAKKNISKFYIYCFDKSKYQNLMDKYPRLKGVFNDFDELISALSSDRNITNNDILSSNLIYLEDYNRVYIKLHYEIIRKYSLYKELKSQNNNRGKFLELVEKKKPYYLEIAKQLLYHDDNDMINFFMKYTNESEETLKKVFNNIHNVKQYISNYTVESFYYKYINKFLREGNFESFKKLSNHISKFIYHLLKYKNEHDQEKEAILYRNMNITPEEFNKYSDSIGRVICYPAFTSTSLNQNCMCALNEKPNTIMVKLIIRQNKSKSVVCISGFSEHPNEEEYLFLPFSFFKITQVIRGLGTSIYPHLIYLTALRSVKPIEDMLLDYMEKETDNLDPEGLKMIKLSNIDNTFMSLNPNLFYEVYKNI